MEIIGCSISYSMLLKEPLGKGFFVQRDVLQHTWTTLSLPEEDLLKFLSLCRMLHWSQIHWLELFAVMVGSLNDNFHSTVQMLFELLTDDPEGGPSPIPSWMFNVCYSFIARLDCSKPQSFVNGRKVLGDNQLEDENREPDPPKIYSLDLFRYALIERFIQNEQYRQFERENEAFDAESQKSFFSHHTNVTTSFNFVGLNERENLANEANDFKSVLVLLNEAQREALTKFDNRDTRDKIIQHLLIEKKIKKPSADISNNRDNTSVGSMDESAPSTVRTDISASMRFIGNLKNPYEVIKKTPDIDCVLMALSKEQKKTLRNVTKRQTGDERVKEELFRDLSTSRDSHNSENELDSELHVDRNDLAKGLEPPWSWVHQFAAPPQSEKSYNFVESDTTPADGTPHLLTDGSFDFCTGHFKDDASTFDDSALMSTGKLDDSADEPLGFTKGLIDDLMEEIDTAISKGQCDIKDVKSICSVIAGKRPDGGQNQIKVITDALQTTDDCTAQFENVDELGNYLKKKCSIEPLSKKLLECDLPIEENIATKKVPDHMILGLVEPKAETSETAALECDGCPISPTTVTSDEQKESIRMVEGFITDAIDEIPESDTESEDPILPTFDCNMPALPGIGKACAPKTMDAFLVYILSQARTEKGMVYPRYLKEPNCPVMMNSLN